MNHLETRVHLLHQCIFPPMSCTDRFSFILLLSGDFKFLTIWLSVLKPSTLCLL